MAWLDELREAIGPNAVSTGASDREQHSRGESYAASVLPDAVVRVRSTEDVANTLRVAARHGIPVTPVAANSSLEGQTVPLEGGISLDLSEMNRILAFEPENLLAVVQPGVTYPQINEHVRRRGLFFPVDPGAHASLGGMIATNASGTAAVRYGVTADFVMGLEFVTASGDVLRTGGRARKSASGLDLKRLLCGSEGTLAVITEVTLRLVGLPPAASAARVPFPSARAATEFVTAVIQAGIPVARCELIDARSIAAVNTHQGTSYPEEMTVFLEFHGNEAGVHADAELAREVSGHHGAGAFESSSDADERERLWEARHNMFYAAVAANPGRSTFITDVAVPIAHLADAVDAALEDLRRAELDAYLVGHVGDGNFHTVIFYDGDDERERIEAAAHRMVERALSVGGTVTGEHGVGIRKLPYMEAEHGRSLETMRAIKRAFDPQGILNPGKKLPPTESSG